MVDIADTTLTETSKFMNSLTVKGVVLSLFIALTISCWYMYNKNTELYEKLISAKAEAAQFKAESDFYKLKALEKIK